MKINLLALEKALSVDTRKWRILDITTDELIYNKENRTFCNDASSLGLKPGQIPLSVRVKNPKTGRTVYFHTNKQTNDGVFMYTAVFGPSRINLKIFND